MFCERCRLPLVPEAPDGGELVSERHQRVRKIKPQLSEGPLAIVAHASNQAEAEFIQSLLLEQGVPSLLRRSAGFDVPDFLAAGPRDVLVPLSGLDTARQALMEAEIVSADAPPVRPVAALRLLGGLLLALAIGTLVLWLLSLLAS